MLSPKQLILVLSFASTLTACSLLDKPPIVTMVQGTIVDKYTKKPLAGIPVKLERVIGHFFGGTDYDSVTATFTDANGHYSISLQNENQYVYAVQPVFYFSGRSYYNLTTYPANSHTEDQGGILVDAGSNLTADFQLVPFIPAKINFTANKQGRGTLGAWIRADDRDGQGYSGVPQIVLDTIPAHQQLSIHRLVYLVPNRTYIIDTYLADSHCKDKYTCQDLNVSHELANRVIAYPDTAIITIP